MRPHRSACSGRSRSVRPRHHQQARSDTSKNNPRKQASILAEHEHLNREYARASLRKTVATDHIVSLAHVQISRSSSSRAHFVKRSTSAFSRSTAKMVEPEPDINAAPTSACFSNHVFSCARKINFSKTGRSRSFTKL